MGPKTMGTKIEKKRNGRKRNSLKFPGARMTRVSLGNLENSLGNRRISSGDHKISPGNLKISLGNLRISQGNLEISFGNPKISEGSLKISQGNLEICFSINLRSTGRWLHSDEIMVVAQLKL